MRSWERGEVILREHDRSDWVCCWPAGSSHSVGGAEVVLAVRDPGTLIGEFSAIDRQPRSATVTALDAVTGLVVLLPAFETLLRAHGRVSYLLTRLVVGRVRDADRKRIEFGTFDTTGRVAARLVELAERFGEPSARGSGSRCRCRRTSSPAGPARPGRRSRGPGHAAVTGWVETSRLRVVVRDLAALRGRAGKGRLRD